MMRVIRKNTAPAIMDAIVQMKYSRD